MATVNSYLNFNGNTEEAFNFYKSVFGGQFTTLVRFKDTPEKDKLPAGDQNKIMHVSLPIGKENTLMGTDTLESQGHKLSSGNNIHLSVSAQNPEEGTRLFNALAKAARPSCHSLKPHGADTTASLPTSSAFNGW